MNAEILANMREDDFLKEVIKEARLNGWIVFHDWHPQRNPKLGKSRYHKMLGTYLDEDDHTDRANNPGLPDLILVHRETGCVAWRELKRNKGKLKKGQIKWRDALLKGDANWELWRPKNWNEIKRYLQGGGDHS